MFSKKLITLFTAISIIRADVCSSPCGNAGSTGGTNVVPGYGACLPLPQQGNGNDVSNYQVGQPQQTSPPLQQVGTPVQFAPVIQQQNEPQKSCNLTTTMNCTPAGEGSQIPNQPKPEEKTTQTPPLPPVEVVSQPPQPQQPHIGLVQQPPTSPTPIMGVDQNSIQCPAQPATFGNQTGQTNNGQDHVFGSCFSNATNKVNYPTVIVGNVEMPASPNLTISQNGCGTIACVKQ